MPVNQIHFQYFAQGNFQHSRDRPSKASRRYASVQSLSASSSTLFRLRQGEAALRDAAVRTLAVFHFNGRLSSRLQFWDASVFVKYAGGEGG